jgi:hypothetical protein
MRILLTHRPTCGTCTARCNLTFRVLAFDTSCRQWREEREQLIQCIHLQQLELAQRSAAAHDRAADIAKV